MVLVFALALLTVPPASAAPQSDRGARLLQEIRAGDRTCGGLSDADFEAVGEYAMDRQLGSSRAHRAMDELMESMMGERAERRMHVYRGRRATRCGGGRVPTEFGGMMAMMRGLGGSASMVGGPGAAARSGDRTGAMMGRSDGVASRDDDDWSTGAVLLALLLVALVVLAGGALWRRHRPIDDQGPAAADILARRYARGEIDDNEYERRRHALGGAT